MAMPSEKYVDVDGIKTRYFDKGEGEPLILLHGGNFGSNDAVDCAWDWELNIDGLARWFHVYAVEKLGQGRTDITKIWNAFKFVDKSKPGKDLLLDFVVGSGSPADAIRLT